MLRLPFRSQGTNIAFTAGGVVVRVDAGGDTPIGHWRSDNATNSIKFDVSGAPQTVSCLYSFNTANQLVVQLRNSDRSSTIAVTLAGSIHVLDSTEIVYTVVDDSGHVTTDEFNISGRFSFDNNNHLVISFPDGAPTTSITGNAAQPIQALRNLQPGATAQDKLRFVAATKNSLSGGGTLTLPASIDIAGTWNVADGTIVFRASGGTDPTNPPVIGFAGKFKGVSAGFLYTPGPGGGQGAFLIAGTHTWNSGTASWDVLVGFSNNKFQAQVSGQFASADGLTIGGKLDITKGAGTAASFDLELKVQKRFNQAGMLTVQADVSAFPGHPVSYDLKLEGTFRFNGVALTFDAKVSNAGATVAIGLASTSNVFDLKFQLSMTLKGTNHPTVDLGFSFSLTMTFQNGKLVKGDPELLSGNAHPAMSGHN
jgi:hypothetical protein